MPNKSEWVRRAMAAEEKLDASYAERLELQIKIQELTQEVERLADENEEHRHMAKRWRMAREIMIPANGVHALVWDPRDFDEQENQEFVDLTRHTQEGVRQIHRIRARRELKDFAKGLAEVTDVPEMTIEQEDGDEEDR